MYQCYLRYCFKSARNTVFRPKPEIKKSMLGQKNVRYLKGSKKKQFSVKNRLLYAK